jgi:hypothetical protein
LGGMSKLRMRATSDSGVGDSGRSNTLSVLILRPPLDGGGDRQRNGSGEVGREEGMANRPDSTFPNDVAEGGGDRVSDRR